MAETEDIFIKRDREIISSLQGEMTVLDDEFLQKRAVLGHCIEAAQARIEARESALAQTAAPPDTIARLPLVSLELAPASEPVQAVTAAM